MEHNGWMYEKVCLTELSNLPQMLMQTFLYTLLCVGVLLTDKLSSENEKKILEKRWGNIFLIKKLYLIFVK